MSTTLTEPEAPARDAELIVLNPQQALAAYSITDDAIAQLKDQYSNLIIDGIDDKAGEAVVHEARMIVKLHRVEVENTRKRLKAGALEFGRVVDAEAKRITALLTPIEEHLAAEEDAVKEQRAKIKAARLQARVDKLVAVGSTIPVSVIEGMPDDKFAEFLADATRGFQARKERERLEAEERDRQARIEAEARAQREAEAAAARKAEADRLEAERQRLDADRQRLEAERAEARRQQEVELAIEKERVAAERRELEAERARIAAEQRKAELETARAQAAERAKREEAERIERERVEAEERAKAEAAARDRAEALRPDREKLLAWVDTFSRPDLPFMADDRADGCRARIKLVVESAAAHIREIIDEALPE